MRDWVSRGSKKALTLIALSVVLSLVPSIAFADEANSKQLRPESTEFGERISVQHLTLLERLQIYKNLSGTLPPSHMDLLKWCKENSKLFAKSNVTLQCPREVNDYWGHVFQYALDGAHIILFTRTPSTWPSLGLPSNLVWRDRLPIYGGPERTRLLKMFGEKPKKYEQESAFEKIVVTGK